MRKPKDLKALEKREGELSALIIALFLILVGFIIMTCFYITPPETVIDEYTSNVLLVGFTGLSLLFCAYIAFEKLRIKHLRSLLISVEAEKSRILEESHAELEVSRNELEKKVKELKELHNVAVAREKELKTKMKELEEFHDLAVGRELKMKKIEGEMEALKRKLGEKEK